MLLRWLNVLIRRYYHLQLPPSTREAQKPPNTNPLSGPIDQDPSVTIINIIVTYKKETH